MSPQKLLILVVDDEESMRWFLERTLRREGYDVLVAEDGPEAIRLAQDRPPTLVLADVRMPGMDGVALMRALRTLLPGVPVVLMTAFGAVDDALHAMKQGAVDYITKPFRVEQIRDVVSRSMGLPTRAPTLRDVTAESDEDGPPPLSQVPAMTSGIERSASDGALSPAASPLTPLAVLKGSPTTLAAYLRARVEERGLPMAAESASGDLDLRGMTRLAEALYVDELLLITEGNVSRAAEIAGITRPNLHRKIQDLGLAADSYRAG